ncbi:MAG: DUF4339 domain-containing protein [Acidimicrobiia bacterium]|nr:DUF4339 domain-containing protein [Acidimicrobiia bacterium]
MSDRTWLYLAGQDSVGPIDEQALIQMAATGHLFLESYVWTDGLPAWTRLGEVEAFSGVARPAPPDRRPDPPDRFTHRLLPVDRSGWAAAAGYLGLLSVLVIPAPLALAVGVVGVRDIRRSEERTGRRLSGMESAVFGIVAGVIFTGVLVWGIAAMALG